MQAPSKNTQGFTLIELIVVISVIGILAAIAIPRFIALQKDARVAKAHAIYGNIRTAVMLVRSRCELDLALTTPSTCSAASGNVSMDGTSIRTNYKYPAATWAGIITAAQIDYATNNQNPNDGITINGGGALAGSTETIGFIGATTPAQCQITYTSAATRGSSPKVTLVTTGC